MSHAGIRAAGEMDVLVANLAIPAPSTAAVEVNVLHTLWMT